MTFWDANLEALAQYRPDLHRQISAHDCRPVGEFVQAESGDIDLSMAMEGGKSLPAHGMRNPWREAEVYLRTVTQGSTGLVVFVGMGLGYGPMLVLRERPEIAMMVVLEPSVDLFCAALRAMDLQALIANPKVSFFVGPIDFAAVEQAVTQLAATEDTHIVHHAQSLQWRQSLYEPLFHRLFMLVNTLSAAGGTAQKYGGDLFRNRLANLSSIRHSSSLDALRSVFDGKPAVLVAAGPSLDLSLEELKRAQGHCVLFAVDSALAPLLRAGIVPDFVTSIDYLDLNFEKVAPFLDRTWPFALVTTIKGTALIPKRLPARHHFLAFYEDLPHNWILRALGVESIVPSVLSVAHLNLGLAQILGADPIVFVGQDLAYTSAEVDHATGAMIKRQGLPTDRQIFQAPGVDGKPVATDRGFLSLLKVFEDIVAAHPGTAYVNASAAGAHIAGTQTMPLSEAVHRYMKEALDVRGVVDAAVRERGAFPVTSLLSKGARTCGRIPSIKEQIREARGVGARAGRDIESLRRKGVVARGFEDLPDPLAKGLKRFDRLNLALNGEAVIAEHVAELTYTSQADHERMRRRNDQTRQTEGYLAWLEAEIARADGIQRQREEALDLYRDLLGRLVRHLEEEEALLSALGRRENERDLSALAQLYVDSGDLLLARAAVERLLFASPSHAKGRFLSGVVKAGLLDFPLAREEWARAIEVQPGLAEEVETVRLDLASFWLGLADGFGNPGEGGDNFPQFLPVWLGRAEEILRGQGRVPEALPRLWEKHLSRMEAWLREGRLDLVEVVLAGWAPFAERFPEILVQRARYHHARGEVAEAIPIMEKAAGLKPDEGAWLAFWARLLLEAGRWEEGLRRLEEAVARDPQSATLWEEVGDALAGQGDAANALTAYEQCLRALPDRLEVLGKIGDCYLGQGQPEAALAAYEALQARRPGNADIQERVGQIREMMQK